MTAVKSTSLTSAEQNIINSLVGLGVICWKAKEDRDSRPASAFFISEQPPSDKIMLALGNAETPARGRERERAGGVPPCLA